MFPIRNLPHKEVTVYGVSPAPVVIEGVEVYDTLCPVSKLTGLRENPVSLLSRVLDPAKVRALDSILQELPSNNEFQGLSDDEALDLLSSRLETGSRSEDAVVRERLASVIDVLRPHLPESKDQKIEFNDVDVQTVESK